jgi:serine/threonine protein kinase
MSLCINPRCTTPQNPDNLLFCQACGSELLLQGRYRAANILGSGGFGKTYEVKEGSTSKVLKVLMNNSSKAVELFQREAQVLNQLNNDGIPKVEANAYFIFYPKDDPQPLHCMVMEKIDGDNLWNYIKKRGRPIDGDLARRWLIELVEILQQVHERDILHRDIKPQNIILKPDGKLVLIDFGAVTEEQGTELATQASGGGSGTEVATNAGAGTSISSQGYTSFEQIHGQAAPQSDFFALGRTFIYLLTAKEPVDKSIYDAFNDELNWRQFAPSVSSDLADLIDQMMARLPRDRPKSASAVLERLMVNPSANRSSSRLFESVPAYSQREEKERVRISELETPTPKQLIYAGPFRRFIAFLLDVLVLSILTFLLALFIINTLHLSGGYGIFTIILLIFQYYSLDSYPRATLGKSLMGIVVTTEQLNSGKTKKRNYIIRALLKISLFILFIGPIFLFLACLFTKKKRGLHDLASGSVVVLRKSVT